MTERERLIGIIKKAGYEETVYTSDGEPVTTVPRRVVNEEVVEGFADYLLRRGVIVPPCRVGDIVYLFYPVRKGIYEAVVDEISLSQKSNFIVTRDLYFNRRTAIFFEQIGKTVFFTKEEAEKALKERSKENAAPN